MKCNSVKSLSTIKPFYKISDTLSNIIFSLSISIPLILNGNPFKVILIVWYWASKAPSLCCVMKSSFFYH